MKRKCIERLPKNTKKHVAVTLREFMKLRQAEKEKTLHYKHFVQYGGGDHSVDFMERSTTDPVLVNCPLCRANDYFPEIYALHVEGLPLEEQNAEAIKGLYGAVEFAQLWMIRPIAENGVILLDPDTGCYTDRPRRHKNVKVAAPGLRIAARALLKAAEDWQQTIDEAVRNLPNKKTLAKLTPKRRKSLMDKIAWLDEQEARLEDNQSLRGRGLATWAKKLRELCRFRLGIVVAPEMKAIKDEKAILAEFRARDLRIRKNAARRISEVT